MQHPTASISPHQQSSSERSSSSAAPVGEVKEANESDNESRKVPEMEGGPSTSVPAQLDNSQASSGAGQRKRGRNPADKEHNRLKRLLRNRVSAQQARERKKAYLSELEAKVKDLEQKNSELEEKASTLQNENHVLRQLLKNTTMKKKGVEG